MGIKGDKHSITLQLETVSTCNAKCHFCPYTKNIDNRQGKLMDMELFKKVADQQAEIPQMGVMILQGLGEPLLDRHLNERLKYAEDLNIYTSIFTNGFALTPDRFNALIENGLDSLVVSLNAVTAEQHEKIMGVKGRFDKIVAACDYIIANKPDDFEFAIHTVRNDDQFTAMDSAKFALRWGVRNLNSGYGRVIEEGNWAKENREAPIKGNYHLGGDKGCARANNQFYVLWDGRVTTCCFDPTGKNVWGNLNVQTIKEVYSNPAYVQFREDHWNDKATRHEICRGCTRI
jgi:radical SAM protein with 4Fe4S-binding SPASM domain